MVAGIFGAESSFIDGMNHCNSVPNKGFHMMDAPTGAHGIAHLSD
ncbi:hypothetical protein [Pseudomonas silesiensis]